MLIYAQDSGVGYLNVDEQKILPSTDNTSNIILGVSDIGDKYTYLTTNSGSKHIFGKSDSMDTLYYFDVLNRKIMTIDGKSESSVSDAKGLYGYMKNLVTSELLDNKLGAWLS